MARRVQATTPSAFALSVEILKRGSRLSCWAQIPATVAENAPGTAHELLVIDAAKSVLRWRLRIHAQWEISVSVFEGPEIPRTPPKIAENGCRVWDLSP